MSAEQQEPQDQFEQNAQFDELAMLKERAKLIGVTFSNNIGVEALKEKINAKMAGVTQAATAAGEAETAAQESADGEAPAKPAKVKSLRQMLYDENMRLVRLRITNLDPKKKDLPGELLTVANGVLGTVTKFIPFGEVTENGYHVPYCLYKMMKARKFLNIRVRKDRANQHNLIIEQNWVPEFALEVLPQLTPSDLAKLGASQLATGATL